MSGGRAAPLVRDALADARPASYWTDGPQAPPRRDRLTGRREADLVVVGAGFTGLWTAWRAVERGADPAGVVLLESEHVGYGASGRNGGFISASLTHGLAHGEAMWPRELPVLQRMGEDNLAALTATVRQAAIECDLQLVGKTTVAVEPWHVPALAVAHERNLKYGEDSELLDADQMRADVASPTYLGGLRVRSGGGLLDPARLAWGLAEGLERRGVRVHEGSAVRSLRRTGSGVEVRTDAGVVTAAQVVVATAAYPSPLRRLRAWVLPVYDHVLATEPLTSGQLESLGWRERQGLTDPGNQFHYYRLTADDRILWGGWDATYYRGNRVAAELEQAGGSHELLAEHFFATFPQLAGVRFTHRWAGPIDSTSRFTAAYGRSHGGRVAYAAGHTGLGVGASRFSADVALDLLSGESTERTRLSIVRRRPVPFPPEPLRDPLVRFTQRALAKADADGGRPGWWLRTIAKLGMGFSS